MIQGNERVIVPRKHGLAYHPLFRVWGGMKERCYNTHNAAFPRYGGRGITVCEAWAKDFKPFYDWAIEAGWRKGLQIERVNNDEGYSPDNCKIATAKEQCRNRSSNVRVEIQGRNLTLIEWSEESGISYDVLYKRAVVNKWPLDKLLKPVQKRLPNHRPGVTV